MVSDEDVFAIKRDLEALKTSSGIDAATLLATLMTLGDPIPNLNADKLDGNHASDLMVTAELLSRIQSLGSPVPINVDKVDGYDASSFLLASNYIEASSFSNYSGYIKFKNSLQLCWGYGNITPTAEKTPTCGTINFPRAFPTNIPIVIAGMSTTYPGTIFTGVSTGTITLSSVDIWVTRTNTTACTVRYLAVGR
jgi:hypothetical protein